MPDFKMPPIEVGQTVLYHIDGDKCSEPCIGHVLVVAGGNLTLAVIRGHATRVEIADGVMHVDDPRVKNQYNDSGAWDYTAWDRKLMEYMDGAKSPLPKAGPPVKRGPGRPKKEPELESVGT